MDLLIAVVVEAQREFNSPRASERTIWRVPEEATMVDVVTTAIRRSTLNRDGHVCRCTNIEVLGKLGPHLRHVHTPLLEVTPEDKPDQRRTRGR